MATTIHRSLRTTRLASSSSSSFVSAGVAAVPRRRWRCALLSSKTSTLSSPRHFRLRAVAKDPQVASEQPLGPETTPKGIPERMGGHLMPSGEVAPISVSKGAGKNVATHMFSYPDSAAEIEVTVSPDAKGATDKCASLIEEAAARAIQERGCFTLAVSGGSALNALATLAAKEERGEGGNDFSKWYIFFADERCVPLDHDDSNYRGLKEAFLSKAPNLPAENVFALDPTKAHSPQLASTAYEMKLGALSLSTLPRHNDMPVFDFVLLGCGPDAHCASLFPNRAELSRKDRWILPITDSPKPPCERITLSLPVLNNAKNIAFFATGYGKSESVQRVLEVNALPGALPCQMVRPEEGKVVWCLDDEAASDLHFSDWEKPMSFPRSELPKPEKKK